MPDSKDRIIKYKMGLQNPDGICERLAKCASLSGPGR